MPVTMHVTTMEKGGSGNASTTASASTKTGFLQSISKDSPYYEEAQKLLEDRRAKEESDKQKKGQRNAKYFSENIQPFVKTYDYVTGYIGNGIVNWSDQHKVNDYLGMYDSLSENYKKLQDAFVGNDYLRDSMSEEDYKKTSEAMDAIGKALEDGVSYVRQAGEVYGQFGNAGEYNRHVKLSGMSADELQREIDALDKQIGDMGSADSYYDTMYVMGQPMKKATEKSKKFESDLAELERKKKELTSYRDTARLGENVKKYGVDPSKLSYEALTSYVNDKNLSMNDPGKYDFIKSYYDGMDAGEKADLFVKGLDPRTRDLYEKASELITKNSASNAAFYQGSTLSEASADLKRIDELIGIISSKTGADEQTVRKNIGMVQRHMNAERAEETGKAVVKAVEKAPVLSNIASVGLNLGGGLFALADQAGQTIANKIAGENEAIDTNTAAQSIVKISDDIRNTTRKKIEKSTNVTLPSGANLGAYLYDTAMSLADVVAQTSTGRIIGAGLSGKALNNAISATTALIVGSNSAASTVQESVESGESSVRSLAKGLAVGLIESLIEKAGIDNVLNATLRGDAAAKVILRSALAEGTEEVLTNIATEDFLESYVFGGSTRYQKAFESYISQGLSREEAAKRASADVVAQDAETFLSSALIGAVFGGVTAVSNRANDKANTKLAQDGINNRIGGIGEIEFLKAVNGEMVAAAEEFNRTHNDAQYKAVDDEVLRRIQYIQDVKEDIRNNSSLRNVIGESGIQQEVAKMEANIATLTDKLNLIRNGEYDPTVQGYMISLMEEDLTKSTEEQAKSQRNVLKAAQMYLSAFGSEKKAVEAAKKTAAQENARAAELSAERNRLTQALATADETQKVEINRRLQEIGLEIKRTARNVIRAGKVEKALGDQYRSAINSALGGNEKELSKRLTNALGREVKVAYDDNAKGFSSMKTGADSSTLTVNPELILRTENALRQEFGEEYTGNLAKEKLVHEIAHAAARSDANFDAKVLEIYHLLRDNGLITDDDIDEAATREAYKDTLKRYMATEPAKAEVRRLVEAGNAEADAIAEVENAYIGEELVAQTLEWMERATNGQLSREILGEKRNVFVQALNRIAEIFRSVAAKLKGVDNVNAAKTAGFADKIERFAREFAERGVAEMNEGTAAVSQESAGATQSADNAQGNSGEGAVASSESEATTGTQEEDGGHNSAHAEEENAVLPEEPENEQRAERVQKTWERGEIKKMLGMEDFDEGGEDSESYARDEAQTLNPSLRAVEQELERDYAEFKRLLEVMESSDSGDSFDTADSDGGVDTSGGSGASIGTQEEDERQSLEVGGTKKDNVITIGMSDSERTRILSGKNVIAPVYSGEADASIDKERNKLNGTSDLAKAALVRIGEEFGVFTSFNADDIDVQVTFSRGNLRESVFKGADIDQLAKLLPVLRDSVQKAVGVERHENRYYYDTFTTSVSELVGAYVDGEYIVPVRFGLKHLVDGNNTLHVVVGQPSFKIDGKKNKTGVMEVDDRQSGGHPTSRPVYEISIAQIFANVNTKDLLRYVPDDFLNENQRKIKWDGIADTIKYTNDKNDKKYAEFIRKGNLSAAMSMVAAAAKANGYTIEAWHGSRNTFTSFSREKLGSSTRTKASERWFFAADKETAESYHPYSVMKKLEEQGYWKSGSADSMKQKGELYHLFLKMENPLEVDVAGYDYASHRENADAFVEYLDQAEHDGNDGIILYHVRDNNLNTSAEESTDYLFKNPSQAKSADVIVYDDNGNVIPLSERFNTNNDDIRYSLSDEQRMKRQAENIAFLKKQIQRGRSYAVSPSALDKVWTELRRGYGIDKADEQTVRDMFKIVDDMSMHKMDADEGMARLNAMAREVLTNVYQVDDRLMRENEAFIQYIRSTPLSVPADNESDLGGKYGDYRNENRRYVNLSREGTPVESVYEQICDMFPGILDRSVTHPADQIHEIVDAMRSMEPDETPVYSEVLGSAAESFVSDIMAKMDRYSRETFRSKSEREKEILRDNAERRAAAERNRSDVLRAREAEVYEKRVKRMETQNRNTVNAYEARIQGIETAAARDAMQYREIINNLQNRMDEISVKNDRRDYSSAIRRDARVIRSAAVSPNQKRYIPEEHRKTIERIADFLDKVSRYNGTYRMDMADMAVYKDIQSLAPLYGEDFADTAAYLVNEIDWTAGADMAEDRVAPMVALRVANNAYKLGRLLRTSIARQNRMVLDGKNRNANYISGELIDSLNNRRNVEKEFNTLETDAKGRIRSSSDSGKFPERLEKRTRKTRKWISLNTMDGYSFLRRMGKVGESLYDTLRTAQSEQIMHVQEYVKTLQDKLLKDQQDGAKGVDLSRYIGDKQKTVTVTLSNGKHYTMTAAQAMTIVTLYKREAGKSHIENGGVRLVHPKDKTLSAAMALKAEDVAAIAQNLDEDDRRVMKVMNDFIREQCTEWGNEATLERYGFYRFNTQHYFPITVDRNALPSNVSAEGAKDYLQFNVQNVGFAKAADASAKAPVVIDSFISVINRHVEGMATYAAYLNAEDIVNRLMSAPGVKDAMQRSLGTGSVKYMTDMMTELKQGNRGGSEDALTQWWNKSAGHYKSAAVSYNLSTALKQPISIVRAAAVLDPKYILAAKRVPFSGTGKAAHEEMMQYSGIGVKKSIGYSDVGISRDINAQIGYEKKDLSKKVRNVSEFGMALAGYMDERTWDSIWIACREEVKDKKPDLTANHEAFMNEVAKRFAEVVAQTQVVDSPLDSSPLSRSKNPLARNVFAFTSEPIKGFNLLMNAMDDLINAEKGSIRQKQAAAQMARTAVITLVGWAAEASISAAFQMIRDEDDDEGEIGKEFAVKAGRQMLSNAYNAVPYVGQAVDIILDAWKGYDFTDMGIAPLVDVIDSAKSVMDTLRNPENKSETIVKAGRDLVESVATFFGIPIRNFNRDVVAGLRLFFHGTNLYTAEYEMQKIFYNPKSSTAREKHEFNSLLTDAYLSGNKKAFEHIYNDMRSMGLSPQTIMNGIAKDAYAQDITSSGTTLTRYTPGSDAWYIGMKGIFDRDLSAPDGLEKELTRLYKATEEKGVLPKYKSDSYTVDGESREMSVKDHEAVLSEYSKLYYEIATILRNSPAYKNADDTLKAYWMAQAERYAGAISIYRVDSEYNLRTKWWEKMKDKPYYDVAGYIITNLKPSKEDE